MFDSVQYFEHSQSKLVSEINLKEFDMLRTIILVLLILMLLGAIPVWPHSVNWGYAPSGGLGLVIIVLFVLILLGVI